MTGPALAPPRVPSGETFGEQVRRHRERLGLTMRELAELVGTDAARVSDYENGKRLPGLAVLGRLALALEAPLVVDAGDWIATMTPVRR